MIRALGKWVVVKPSEGGRKGTVLSVGEGAHNWPVAGETVYFARHNGVCLPTGDGDFLALLADDIIASEESKGPGR